MPNLFKAGLIASGSGVALFVVAVAVGVGPCRGTVLGTVALLAGLFLLPAGILLCIAAGVLAIIERKSRPVG